MHINLEKIGFSQKESQILNALNKNGPLAASTIARLTQINRVSTYDTLERLAAKDIVISYKQGSTLFFAIDDIEKLTHQATQHLHDTQSLVEQLKTHAHSGSIDFQYYKGTEGMIALYEDIHSIKGVDMLVWVDMEKFYAAFPKEYDDRWTKERVANKVKARLLMKDSDLARAFQKKDKNNFRETKLISYPSNFHSACFIFGNHVCFFDTSPEHYVGVRFTNKSVADMQRNIFEMQWSLHQKTT